MRFLCVFPTLRMLHVCVVMESEESDDGSTLNVTGRHMHAGSLRLATLHSLCTHAWLCSCIMVRYLATCRPGGSGGFAAERRTSSSAAARRSVANACSVTFTADVGSWTCLRSEMHCSFNSASTLLVGRQEGHPACRNWCVCLCLCVCVCVRVCSHVEP